MCLESVKVGPGVYDILRDNNGLRVKLVSVQKRVHFQIDLERRRTISVLAPIFRRYTGSIVQMHD
jgi:hypothetical protein